MMPFLDAMEAVACSSYIGTSSCKGERGEGKNIGEACGYIFRLNILNLSVCCWIGGVDWPPLRTAWTKASGPYPV